MQPGNICLEQEFDEAGVNAISFVLKLFGQSDSGKNLLKDRELTASEIRKLIKMPQLKSLAKRAGINLTTSDMSNKKEGLQKQVLQWYRNPHNMQSINGKNTTMQFMMSGLPFMKPLRSPELPASTLNEGNVLKWAA